MTPFRCTHCQATAFFENLQCGQCAARLAYDPAQARMQAYRDDTDAQAPWQPLPAADALARPAVPVSTQPCRNRLLHGNCNWMLDDAADHGLCRSCRLTRTIPDLGVAGNAERWARIEQAKRRLVFALARLGLQPLPQHHPEGDPCGLCFDLLADPNDGPPVRTGHDAGVIVLNIAEADDDQREARRVAMGEPMRTLLGHLRHELSHYLQWRWLGADPGRMARCRAVFGDEQADYAAALQQHYAQGPAPGWEQAFISAYASAHPWEDWAETCAHWLLIVDAVETAAAWGLQIAGPAHAQPAAAAQGAVATPQALVLEQWLPVAQFLNAMNRSIGVRDSYPFLMPTPVLDKLEAVATLLAEAVQDAGQAAATAPASIPCPTEPVLAGA